MSAVDPAICRDDSRRLAAVRGSALTGLDYLEVDEVDRRKLKVVFIGRLPEGVAGSLTEVNFEVRGGRRARDLKVMRVEECSPADPELDDCVTLTLDRIGDFSTYTLCVVAAERGRPTGQPHPAFDPRYACLDFTFTAGCPSDLDCRQPAVCPPPVRPRPAIDYLAKDYASFRQLMLDRLAVLVPGWTERHVPDLMLTLVELLAYEGDRLSYLQDAVATEAYLNTARQRISVRRHARLVDYFLHEGCNARAWVFVKTGQDTPAIPLADLYFTTLVPGPPPGAVLSAQDLSAVADDAYEVFEPVTAPSSTRFDRRSVRDPARLCRRLRSGRDPVARFLRDRMQKAVVDALLAWNGAGAPPRELVDAVLDELNRLAQEQSLYDEKVFVGQRRSETTRKLRQAPPTGRMVELNRSVLRDQLDSELTPPGMVSFHFAHNCIHLYTWGERECCLPKGATAASLLDECPDETASVTPPEGQAPAQAPSGDTARTAPRAEETPDQPAATHRCLKLEPGDYLLFEEVLGPHTARGEDADPSHRHVVRLTGVAPAVDPVLGHTVLEVEWAAEDALPFPLCVSTIGPAPCCALIEDVSVARGNVLLVDHGREVVDELPPVEVDSIQQPCEDDCRPEVQLEPAPYRPALSRRNLTYAVPLVDDLSAAASIAQDPHQALPSISLTQISLAPPDIESPDPLARYRAPLLPTVFDPEDVLSVASLAKRMKGDDRTMDPLTARIKAWLDADAIRVLGAWNPADSVPEALADALRRALSARLDDAAFFTEGRFPQMDEPTRALFDARPLPADLERLLDRWMLEQALPDVLAPSRRLVQTWAPRFDLLEAGGDDRVFVVEMTDDRRAELRFGDDDLGEALEPASRFRARYRVGNGIPGNVGAEAIHHVGMRGGTISGLTLWPRNPLAARGGTEPELLDAVRLRAPHAIRRDLQRAITAADYAALAFRDFAAELQGAAARLEWTGSWYAARVGLDPLGREEAAPRLLERVSAGLEKYRRMGHDVEVVSARYVPLVIRMRVCVTTGYQKAHVLAALRDVFGVRRLSTGALGFFHPDNLRFGEGVAVSRLTAVAQALPGVQWAQVERLERMGEGDRGEVEAGYLSIAATEIARVDNDPGFPEDGTIEFVMEGGR